MRKLPVQHRRAQEILIHVIGWCMFLAFPLLFIDRTNENFNWMKYLHHSVVPFFFMIVFYTNYFLLVPRYLFREQVYKYILYNIILIAACGLLLQFVQNFVLPPIAPPHPGNKPMQPRWMFFIRDIVGMGFSAAFCAVICITKRWGKLEVAHRESEKNRTEAELKNLRNQLNPHFLLNTLNNIYALIAFDSDKAQQAVQELSKLLRYMLYDNQQTYVTLGKEADFIYNYIELMRIRLSPNVKMENHLNISKESRTPIAPLIFISLIENAFKHGISPTEPSYINISLTEEGGKVYCEIANTNYPKTEQDKSGSGIGLMQVSKRLELLYPDQYTWTKGISADGKEYKSTLIININN